MTNNNLYIGLDGIMSVIAQRYKSVNLSRSEVLEWAMYAQIHELGLSEKFFYFKDIELTLEDSSNTNYKQAKQPKNIHRLLDIYDSSGNRIAYRSDGEYFYFDSSVTEAYIKYYGVPSDENGEPLFIKGHEVALAYYCLKNYFEEKFMLGELDGQRFVFINERWLEEQQKARTMLGKKSRAELEEMIQIVANVVPKLGYVPLNGLD